ncbi:helix-turn-helix domain-containing protein [Holdemanella biformis]|uniref:helix-turn-helix domain-containing protein n=3 Tax=Erysipelotrichaceae TaxID=128827 RepID=UPI003AB7FFE8
MNGKNGAVCAFIYQLIPLFGREVNNGILIDFQVTNDDIAGFCGISTRNSVNRILRGLREENVITMVNQKIVVLDKDYLKQFIQA